MIGFSQALAEDYGVRLEQDAQEQLQLIVIVCHTMGILIDGLMAYSLSTRGELNREKADVSALATRSMWPEMVRGRSTICLRRGNLPGGGAGICRPW